MTVINESVPNNVIFLRTKPIIKVVNWGGGFEVDRIEMGAFNFLVFFWL
jgi:hypothetical protein